MQAVDLDICGWGLCLPLDKLIWNTHRELQQAALILFYYTVHFQPVIHNKISIGLPCKAGIWHTNLKIGGRCGITAAQPNVNVIENSVDLGFGHGKLWNIHSFCGILSVIRSNGGLAEPPLVLYGRVIITSHTFVWRLLLLRIVSSLLV